MITDYSYTWKYYGDLYSEFFSQNTEVISISQYQCVMI